MGKIKGIIKVAIFGAILGAIIAIVIYLCDTVPYESAWGDIVFRHPANGIKLVDILPRYILIGALAVPFTFWITGINRR
jgi:hypothetical protein